MDKLGRLKGSGVCKACGKIISFYATICRQCNVSGKRSFNYTDGRTLRHYTCKICNKAISISSGVYGSGLCQHCARIGKHIHTIDQRKAYSSQMKANNPMHNSYSRKRFSKTTHAAYLAGRKAPYKHAKPQIYRGVRFRSSWEVLYAKWLDLQNIVWKYEAKTFDLGPTTYTPDFYLPLTKEYVEIKGFQTAIFKDKLRLFKAQYPKIRYRLITREQFISTFNPKVL